MKKCVILFLALAIFSFAFIPRGSAYSQARSHTERRFVEGEIIVKLRENVEQIRDEQLPEQILRVKGARAESLSRFEGGGMSLIHLDPDLSVEEAVRMASEDPRVEFAEPNYLYAPADRVPNDQQFGSLWGLRNTGSGFGSFGIAGVDIGATRAWEVTTGSDDIVAAIIDTGVDLSHPDLAPNAWVNPREVAGNNVDDDGNGYVDDVNGWNFAADSNRTFEDFSIDRHGTHVAGTLGAAADNHIGVAGVAWHVKLMSLKFIGRQDDGRVAGTSADAVKAINYAIDMRRGGVNVRVINASWAGSEGSRSLRKAIDKAGKEGILFVCAAGNGGDDDSQDDVDEGSVFPAGWADDSSSVLSVTTITAAGTVPTWANYGHRGVSVAAPGTDILSTLPGGGYGSDSGTSMSTPHAAGIAVLLWAQNPSLKPSEVKERIIATAEPVLDLASRAASAGRANAYNALTPGLPPPRSPVIRIVSSDKKHLTVDGLGILNGSSVIEVNGAAVDGSYDYDANYRLANGSLTRLTVKLSKSKLKEILPPGQARSVNLYNPTSGERSPVTSYVRN
ncbi:MAG TPA: S8 family peptidase [Blastocatellia bacterium]|jgi:subtilisin family serine protease|nr:S8 family peptidase [Blastocatellia bacterium]